MNIPISLLSKMGNYEIEVEGVKVKVSVVDNSDVLDLFIAELSSSLKESQYKRSSLVQHSKSSQIPQIITAFDHSATPLLAFDLKIGSYRKLQSPLLILCIRARCLVVHWQYCMNPVPQVFKNFLDNKNFCFVGMEDELRKLLEWPTECNHFYTRAVGLGHLAARVLKKPDLQWLGLAELAAAVGLRYKEPKNGTFSDWSTSYTVFSKEEVEYAIHDAYAIYMVAEKLLKLL